MPGVLRHHTDGELLLWVGACEQVLHEQALTVRQVLLHLRTHPLEHLVGRRHVHVTPPHIVLRRGLAHDEAVIR